MTQVPKKQRCLGCPNYLTDPVSKRLGYGPKCHRDIFGTPQPRPAAPRPARPARHRGVDVVEVDLLTIAAAAAGDTDPEVTP